MNESNLFLDRRGVWGCCWRRLSRWPLKTKTEEEEEMVLGGGKTLTPRGGFWSWCDSMRPCSCFIKILGDDETTGGGGGRGRGEDQVVVTGKKGLQESCSSLQEEDSLLMSPPPWMCWNRGGRSSFLRSAPLSSTPRELSIIVAVETEELQLLTTAKRSQSSDMVDDLFWFFFLTLLVRREKREGDKLWRKGRRWLFLCRKGEREHGCIGQCPERNRWVEKREHLTCDSFQLFIHLTPSKKHVNVFWFSYFFSHFILFSWTTFFEQTFHILY